MCVCKSQNHESEFAHFFLFFALSPSFSFRIGINSEWIKWKYHTAYTFAFHFRIASCLCVCTSPIFLFFSLSQLFSSLFPFLSFLFVSFIRSNNLTVPENFAGALYIHFIYCIVVITLTLTHKTTRCKWTHLPENRLYNIYSLSWSFRGREREKKELMRHQQFRFSGFYLPLLSLSFFPSLMQSV